MATLRDKSVGDDLASLKIYFDEEEWKEMSDFAKEIYVLLKKTYEFLVGIGVQASVPTFMQKKIEEITIGDPTDAQKSQVKRYNHNMCSAPNTSIGKCAYPQTLNRTTKGNVSNQSLINSTYASNNLSIPKECKLSQNLDNRYPKNLKIPYGTYNNVESAVEEKSDVYTLGKENVHVTDGSKLIDSADAKQLFRKQVKCPQCEYRTGDNSKLRRHINGVHQKIKPYKCQQCDYRSSYASSLQLHVDAVHEGKKPYKCNKCEHRSSEAGNLRKHVDEVHEGKKPYKCERCEYKSSRFYVLRRHVDAVHEGKRPYNCPKCEFRSSYPSNLTKHMKRVHDGKSDDNLSKG